MSNFANCIIFGADAPMYLPGYNTVKMTITVCFPDFLDGYQHGFADDTKVPDVMVFDFTAWYLGYKKGKEVRENKSIALVVMSES